MALRDNDIAHIFSAFMTTGLQCTLRNRGIKRWGKENRIFSLGAKKTREAQRWSSFFSFPSASSLAFFTSSLGDSGFLSIQPALFDHSVCWLFKSWLRL